MKGTLVVIDMQEVFGAPWSPWASPNFLGIVPTINRLIDAYGSDVVFTQYVAPNEPRGSWVPYFKEWPFAVQPPEAELWKITPELSDAAERARAHGKGPVVLPTFSKWGPDLAALVGPTMVLTGVSTDCCVISTALAAADAGVEVLVVSDATSGIDDETQEKALYLMGLYAPLVTIMSSEELLSDKG